MRVDKLYNRDTRQKMTKKTRKSLKYDEKQTHNDWSYSLKEGWGAFYLPVSKGPFSHNPSDFSHEQSRFFLLQSTVGKKRSELRHLIKERAKKLEEIKQSIKVIKVRPQTVERLVLGGTSNCVCFVRTQTTWEPKTQHVGKF